jgi:hypothetical protein
MISNILLILLQLDGKILEHVNNLYSLVGLFILSIIYIFVVIYNKSKDNKQTTNIIKSFEIQNDKIIKKIEELKEHKNILDSQSSIDIVNSLMTKSMLQVIDGVKNIIESDIIIEPKSLYMSKKSFVFEKVKNLIDTQLKDNIIILSRIYNNNIKLSHYILELNIDDFIGEITFKIFSLTDKKNSCEITVFITNKFSQFIQSIELLLSE